MAQGTKNGPEGQETSKILIIFKTNLKFSFLVHTAHSNQPRTISKWLNVCPDLCCIQNSEEKEIFPPANDNVQM